MTASKKVAPSSAEARRRIQGVQLKNASTESALRRERRACDIRYGIHVPILADPHSVANVAFSGLRVVSVDVGFWPGRPAHATWRKRNAEGWRAKIEANVVRDNDNDERLRAKSWKVLGFWAHVEPKIAAGRTAHILERRSERLRRS